jgi:hypothetical protein
MKTPLIRNALLLIVKAAEEVKTVIARFKGLAVVELTSSGVLWQNTAGE